MAAPLVSVILPVHNAAATLVRAVEGIRTQTLRDWELCAIDDGSTDGSAELLGGFARRDPRVRVLSPGRVGLAEALNRGLAAARGSFVARMDADDEASPQRLRAQLELLHARPEIGVASCRVAFGGDRARSLGYALHVDWINGLLEPGVIALNRFIESPLAHPSVMFRRELVTMHGGYRAGEFPEDYELWLRWMDRGVKCAKVPEVLLTWHDPPGRLSRVDPRYDPEAFFRMKAEYVAKEAVRIARHGGVERGQRVRTERDADVDSPRREIWIWGAGRPTRQRAAHLLRHGVAIAGYIDVDARKTGRKVGGVPVIAPENLPPPGVTTVLGYVGSRGARESIRASLGVRGYVEGRDFLMCA